MKGSSASVEHFHLGPFMMPRIMNGLWQVASAKWGPPASRKEQEKALLRLVEAGLTGADMADHYGDAELIYGGFRSKLPPQIASKVYATTKWCEFHPIDYGGLSVQDFVLKQVQERCRRLGGRAEMLQLHWYNYEDKRHLDILTELARLTRSHPELVATIGLCNFDTVEVEKVCRHLKEKTGSIGIVSNQVQLSVVDTRPLAGMTAACDRLGLKLLTYGSLCGNFMTPAWMGKPAPSAETAKPPLTKSQLKYLDMIMRRGSWEEFQDLLKLLSSIATKYHVTLANVATRWVLQKQAVGAVLVGNRLGVSDHMEQNLKTFSFKLSDKDMAVIDKAATGARGEKTNLLMKKMGDCGREWQPTSHRESVRV